MLGYGQNEVLEFLDGIIGNFPADKAASQFVTSIKLDYAVATPFG